MSFLVSLWSTRRSLLVITLCAITSLVLATATTRPDLGPRRFDPHGQKYIALTLDDGPDPRFTPEVLDLLKEYHATATFFVVGAQVLEYPALVQRTVAEGHEIANHTMTHPHARELSYGDAVQEILDTQQAIQRTVGVSPSLFRVPRGEMTSNVSRAVTATHLTSVHWTVCLESRDATTPEAMAARVMARVEPGAVILMHDGRLDRSASVAALRILLDQLTSDGYRIVTASALAKQDHHLEDADILVRR